MRDEHDGLDCAPVYSIKKKGPEGPYEEDAEVYLLLRWLLSSVSAGRATSRPSTG